MLEVNKGDLVYRSEGWALFATPENEDVQIMEWENASAGKLAWLLHEMLRRHALSTNGLQRFGTGSIVVKRLELIDVTVVVKSTVNSTDLTFVSSKGTTLNPNDVKHVPLAKPTRITTMEDVSLHTTRSIRAHLAPMGIDELELRLRFGVEPGGACLMQVPNPVVCNLGTEDYEAICAQLSG